MELNDKGLKLLEQYDLQVQGTRRGRGSYICETDKGLKLFTDFAGSSNRLAFVNRVLYHLREEGFTKVDVVMPNKEGELYCKDWEENRYVVKDWYAGRECDTKNEGEILEAVRNLARLHQVMRMVPGPEDEGKYEAVSLEEDFVRKNRELKKVRTFIRARHQKNPFETGYLNYFSMFFEQALSATEQLGSQNQEELQKKSIEEGLLCHGDYNQHQVLFCRDGIATTNFIKCRYDVQISDLYQFLRKILEKQNWSMELGRSILNAYEQVRPLSAAEWENLRLRLAYPEKFWKLANHYYGRNKAWIPGKNVEKLEVLVHQQERRNLFLKMLE